MNFLLGLMTSSSLLNAIQKADRFTTSIYKAAGEVTHTALKLPGTQRFWQNKNLPSSSHAKHRTYMQGHEAARCDGELPWHLSCAGTPPCPTSAHGLMGHGVRQLHNTPLGLLCPTQTLHCSTLNSGVATFQQSELRKEGKRRLFPRLDPTVLSWKAGWAAYLSQVFREGFWLYRAGGVIL